LGEGMAKKNQESTVARVSDYGVLLAPVVTEKSGLVSDSGRVVTLRVDPRATKTEIRTAVERVFSVKVEGVRTCSFQGKLKRTMRGAGKRAGYKKAYITLVEGSKIDLIEGL
jgi:large subunit ribosomal protein L23